MSNLRIVVVVFLIFNTYSVTGQVVDFNYQIWLKTEVKDTTFPMIVGTKNWGEGEIQDFTSNHNFGKARSTGQAKGWSLFLQPNGAWAWNIGDGEKRLDYLPTADRQRINDGRLHYLAFSIDVAQRTAWLYFDGQQVAIYSLEELGINALNLENLRSPDYPHHGFQATVVEVRKGILTSKQVRNNWLAKYPKKAKRKLTVADSLSFGLMNWNIWHGGRRDGVEVGLAKTVSILSKSRASIIAMQETYGSGPIIADRLDMIYYYRSSNLSVFSKYPIVETLGWYDPFRFGGVTLLLPNGQRLRVFSLWINHLPNLSDLIPRADNAHDILKEEQKTRGNEIREILSNLPDLFQHRDSIPIIIAGDFNSPSHLDWTEETKAMHRDLVVTWPASKAMADAGFIDAFRSIYPNPVTDYGRTWSPRFEESWQDRIDYIYYSGKLLHCRDAKMLDNYTSGWPSDHAAVYARFVLLSLSENEE